VTDRNVDNPILSTIAIRDRMFLGMQDFDFFSKSNKILPN